MPTPPAALTVVLSLVALAVTGLVVATQPGSAAVSHVYGGGTEQAEPARPVTTTVRQAPYAVAGASVDAILASMARAAPRAGDETFFGLTTTELSFRYRRAQERERCVVRDVQIDLAVSVEMPRWTRPAGAPYEARARLGALRDRAAPPRRPASRPGRGRRRGDARGPGPHRRADVRRGRRRRASPRGPHQHRDRGRAPPLRRRDRTRGDAGRNLAPALRRLPSAAPTVLP